MNTLKEILQIADQKMKDGEFLIDNNRYVNGCYLSGYAIELYLKAVCAKKKDDLFTETNLKDPSYRIYKTHDLEKLIDLSGLRNDLQNERLDANFDNAWLFVTSQSGTSILWSEKVRYINFVSESDAKKFIESLKIVIAWVKKIISKP
jgi:HEPN domain-containing protein